MKKLTSTIVLILFLSFVLVSFPQIGVVKAESKTIVVPDDYVTIQEAINSANEGDTIYVKKGIYHENLGIDKPVTLMGEDIDSTIIDGNTSQNYRVPININGDNVSVSGFTLSYGYAGIQIWDAKYCNISGNMITNAQYGIIMADSENNSITGNIFESIGFGCAIKLSYAINNLVNRNFIDSCVEGIQIRQYSNSNIISENTVVNIDAVAIRLLYSDGNEVINNNITNSGTGITIYVSNNNTVYHNNFINNTLQISTGEWYAQQWGYGFSNNILNENYWSDYNGIGDTPYVIDENNQDNHPLMNPVDVEAIPEFSSIYIRADGTVEGTDKIQRDGNIYTFTSNIFDSIVVEKDDVVIDGAGYSLQGNGSRFGIDISERSNVIVKNTQIDNFHYGIYVENSLNIFVTGNSITNNTYGIDLVSSSRNNSISRNYIASNEVFGIRLYYCPENDILENTITNNNLSGILLYFSDGNNLSENNVTANEWGIYLYGSGYNNVSGNSITNNKEIGLWFFGSSHNNMVRNNITNNQRSMYFEMKAFNNIIYQNNFVNNALQVFADTDSVNSWDKGEEGNYWDNYNGTDGEGNGIGDTPYIINENNQDNYPLTNVIPEFPSWFGFVFILVASLTIVFLKKKAWSQTS